MNGERLAVAARSRVHAALGDPARLSIVDVLVSGDASPGELAEALGMATNLVAHHLRVLERCGLVVRHRSEGDRRRTYLRLVPETLAGLAPAPIAPAPRVVFVCRHNSARSQPAAALWGHRSEVPTDDRPCCSCASTTPAAARWRWGSSPTWPATGPSPGPAGPIRASTSTRPPWPPWPSAASTYPAPVPGRGPTRWSARPTWWSPWAAVTPARSSPASATRT